MTYCIHAILDDVVFGFMTLLHILGQIKQVHLFSLFVGKPQLDLNLNLNSLLVKRQIDNPSPGAVTGGN